MTSPTIVTVGVEDQVVVLAHGAAHDVLDGQDAGVRLAPCDRVGHISEERQRDRERPGPGRQDGILSERAPLAGEGHPGTCRRASRVADPQPPGLPADGPTSAAGRGGGRRRPPCGAGRSKFRSSRRRTAAPRFQMAYSSESTSASAEAEMMFVSEPIVDHSARRRRSR